MVTKCICWGRYCTRGHFFDFWSIIRMYCNDKKKRIFGVPQQCLCNVPVISHLQVLLMLVLQTEMQFFGVDEHEKLPWQHLVHNPFLRKAYNVFKGNNPSGWLHTMAFRYSCPLYHPTIAISQDDGWNLCVQTQYVAYIRLLFLPCFSATQDDLVDHFGKQEAGLDRPLIWSSGVILIFLSHTDQYIISVFQQFIWHTNPKNGWSLPNRWESNMEEKCKVD